MSSLTEPPYGSPERIDHLRDHGPWGHARGPKSWHKSRALADHVCDQFCLWPTPMECETAGVPFPAPMAVWGRA
jgi:hypothetical protein